MSLEKCSITQKTLFYNMVKNLDGIILLSYVCNVILKISIMIYTTSLKHYKELTAKGISCKLVTKSDLNK